MQFGGLVETELFSESPAYRLTMTELAACCRDNSVDQIHERYL